MTLSLPRIIGHRGAARYAPENTLEGFHAAADMGVAWVEFDVKLTRDGVPVLFHDDELGRTTNGHGPVAARTFSELRDLECGSWFSEGYAGIKIPTLEEALDVLISRDLGFNLEIKPCPGREIETAEAALDILSRIWDDGKKLLISSFSHVSLETARDMAPEWPRGLLLDTEWPDDWRALANYLEVATVNIDGNACSREQVEEILDTNRQVLAYTINDPVRARTLFSWGLDSVFSDAPDVIAAEIPAVH